MQYSGIPGSGALRNFPTKLRSTGHSISADPGSANQAATMPPVGGRRVWNGKGKGKGKGDEGKGKGKGDEGKGKGDEGKGKGDEGKGKGKGDGGPHLH